LTGIKAARVAPGQAAAMNKNATATVLDVRALAPRDRHPTIFQLWDALAEGESFELVNDHDPVPLYYQFAAEHTGRFRWEYLECGPQTWRVRLTKGRFADPGFTPKPRPAAPPAAKPSATEAVVLDVRPIFARGGTPCGVIDETAARVQPGQRFVLLVPFEPVPLYTKLGRSGFKHLGSRCEDDGTWRVEFLRQAASSGEPVACCCGEE
jgi:uncharacterized protein (DUF2249 family)